MNNVLSLEESFSTAKKIKNSGKKIVLAGGCFDLIHIGHLIFLQKAKEQGDFLFILVESDEKVAFLKGNHRPINKQDERARLIANLKPVDFAVCLPNLKKDEEYDKIVTLLNPDVIAITENDIGIGNKIRQADRIGARIIKVTKEINNQSTTRLARIISEEN